MGEGGCQLGLAMECCVVLAGDACQKSKPFPPPPQHTHSLIRGAIHKWAGCGSTCSWITPHVRLSVCGGGGSGGGARGRGGGPPHGSSPPAGYGCFVNLHAIPQVFTLFQRPRREVGVCRVLSQGAKLGPCCRFVTCITDQALRPAAAPCRALPLLRPLARQSALAPVFTRLLLCRVCVCQLCLFATYCLL